MPSAFERFYRSHLRFLPGARLRSSDVARFYAAWASANDATSLNAREVKRAMRAIGHRAINSNGIRYCDVALAADHADIGDNFPALPLPSEAAADALASRLESMITELTNIRAEVLSTVH